MVVDEQNKLKSSSISLLSREVDIASLNVCKFVYSKRGDLLEMSSGNMLICRGCIQMSSISSSAGAERW